jgi:hypothetical protein
MVETKAQPQRDNNCAANMSRDVRMAKAGHPTAVNAATEPWLSSSPADRKTRTVTFDVIVKDRGPTETWNNA